MNWIQALVLGLLQGLTEFLPVSSSGHLVIAKALFGIEQGDICFEVAVHAATVLSVIVVFRKDIAAILRGVFKFRLNDELRYAILICVSMVPVFVVGVFFKDTVDQLFGNGLVIVGCCLIATALLLTLSQVINAKERRISFWSALAMGCAQAVAVLPGLSRSGSTIATGLLCGVKRDEVTKFSFLMVLIPVLGEAFLNLIGGDFSSSAIEALPLLIGFAAAFASGLVACRLMIAIVRKARLTWFAAYCLVAGLLCIIFN